MYPQTLEVIKTRAYHLGLEVIVADVATYQISSSLCGLYVQSPDNYGQLHDFSEVVREARGHKVISAVGTDLLALTQHKPPGEQGFDIALGNSQRMGVPMGYGGPHAGFFVTSEELKRKMPGKIIGVSKDRHDNR